MLPNEFSDESFHKVYSRSLLKTINAMNILFFFESEAIVLMSEPRCTQCTNRI